MKSLFFQKLKTYQRLGIRNLLRVGAYRLLLRLGMHPVQRLRIGTVSGPFFRLEGPDNIFDTVFLYPYDEVLNGYRPFSTDYFHFGTRGPDWHINPFNGRRSGHETVPWWKVPDFDPDLGDIKTVWELSRFDWVLQLACWGAAGKKEAIEVINERLVDWVGKNPPYLGVNWKCGQEASIRVMHLLSAAMVLRQTTNCYPALFDLIEMHLRRIEPTIGYAIGQNNNHGTSEAAALYAGGHFLSANGRCKFDKFASIGLKWLEERSQVLFDDEGCFSQYSVNYHRMALDTYSFCESYRRWMDLPSFSIQLLERLQKATRWLGFLTDEKSGDAPNLGANDGARLFPFILSGYRDFRFSVQWASVLFFDKPWFELCKSHCCAFDLMGLKYDRNRPRLLIQQGRIVGNKSGIFIQRTQNLLFVFRRPVFRFRPVHSDALHIDLWIEGINLLRDGGSYSYYCTTEKTNYYSGIKSHNTIEIDSIDPMPRISVFLFANWLKEYVFRNYESLSGTIIKSGYSDIQGRTHIREVLFSESSLRVIDLITGSMNHTFLTWRLCPGKWTLDKSACLGNDLITIDFKKMVIYSKGNLENDFESIFYMRENEIPILRCDITGLRRIVTRIIW